MTVRRAEVLQTDTATTRLRAVTRRTWPIPVAAAWTVTATWLPRALGAPVDHWPASLATAVAASAGWALATAHFARQGGVRSLLAPRAPDRDVTIAQLVETFCASVELKDPATRGHSERMTAYLLLLADTAYRGLAEPSRTHLRYAGLLHDVGKIYVPDRILQKPDKLMTEEYAWIRQHPQVGADIVAQIPNLAYTIPVVLHHHERFDGNGYPVGLKGDEIPLDARIAAIADTFDAMTSARAYRKALDLDTALEEIIRHSGTQFDPALVTLFVRHFDRFRHLFRELHHQRPQFAFGTPG